jgi:peptidyl-prolyl cis-trans isomerase C
MSARSALVVFIPLFLLMQCRSRIPEEEVLARVENAVLTQDAVNKRMAWQGMRPDQERIFVERWVNRELLYLEAREKGFHRNEELEYELEMVEKEYLINQYLESVYAEKIQVTQEEIQAHYEQNRSDFELSEDEVAIQHLLVDNRDAAQLALQEIRAGKPFEKVMEERSLSGDNQVGGDLGFVKRGELIPELERQAFSLPVGQMSPVIKSEFGYHIIKVVKKYVKGNSRDLADVNDEIARRLRVKKQWDVYHDLLYQLQNSLKVTMPKSDTWSTARDTTSREPVSRDGNT